MSNGGPYLSVAVLCEKVLQEATGTLSVIRIIDRVTISAQGMQAPETMPISEKGGRVALADMISGGKEKLVLIRPSGGCLVLPLRERDPRL